MSKNLNRYIYTFLIFLLSALMSQGIEEINLESENKSRLNLNYLSDLYYGNVESQEEVSPVIRLFSKDGLKFENSPVNSIKAVFVYEERLNYEHRRSAGQGLKHNIPMAEPMILVKFNDNKSQFMIDYNITRNLDGYSNDFTQKISQLYVSHNISPNQTLLFGQGNRLPSSYDGSKSAMQQEMILKSQLGRTFGDRRSVGIRNMASYKYVDYDIGIYDSTQYMKEFGQGIDFTGYVMIKPFGENNEAKNNFKFGAGYSMGHNNISYNTYSVFALYDYKKFHIHTEYANSDGYNAIRESGSKADGLYSLVSYELTPKLQLIGRFDNFVADKSRSNIYTNEYTAGITYNILKNFKVMLNYVKRINSNSTDSDMILFATRFII